MIYEKCEYHGVKLHEIFLMYSLEHSDGFRTYRGRRSIGRCCYSSDGLQEELNDWIADTIDVWKLGKASIIVIREKDLSLACEGNWSW